MVSLVAATGAWKRTPCHPSMTCGPLTPSPSTNRPPDRAANDIADMASSAGVLVPSWAIPEASRRVVVRAARYPRGVRASYPHASGTHTDVAPRRSASTTKRAVASVTAPTPMAT